MVHVHFYAEAWGSPASAVHLLRAFLQISAFWLDLYNFLTHIRKPIDHKPTSIELPYQHSDGQVRLL